MDTRPPQNAPEGDDRRPESDRVLRPRRRFLANALAVGAAASAGCATFGTTSRRFAASGPAAGHGLVAPAEGCVNDAAILNFALNLDYLAAEYTTFAVTGVSIEALGIATAGLDTGGGNPGPIAVKRNPSVPFANCVTAQLANELAAQERQHVVFLRQSLACLGVPPAARPALDLYNSFNTLAAMAGLPTPFDPFANDVNFLLGGYILEDVALTALHGAAPLIADRNVVAAAAGLLGIEGYHSAAIRTSLFQMGQGPATNAISRARTSLGNSLDYGVDDGPLGAGPPGAASIALADGNGVAPARTFRQVLNIAYGGVNAARGGFFPNGFNGPIR